MQVNDEIRSQMLISKADGILKIVINNPKKKNAMNSAHLEYLLQNLEQAKKDPEIKVVYLTGAGESFTSGNDFNNFKYLSFDEMANNFKGFINYLIDYPKLLAAGVNGMNLGMGLTMLMHFDIILCSSSAYFVVPFIQTFQSPEGTSSYTFPRYFGKFASHLLYSGQSMNAEEAKNFGFVSQIYDDESFQENAYEYIKGISKYPTEILVKYKDMVTRYDKEILKKVNEYECKKLRESWDHPEFKNIMKKFVKNAKF